ncbi:MAG: AAA family ATPase [Alphaproteobacteria bacterium]|nr:AAA family ATPase [Alphaproteobacteria bacterium]
MTAHHCKNKPGKAAATKLIVVTGGPGAGKTAVLEMLKKMLCPQVAVLPEAASIVFGGGFWRMESENARLASQRAILHIQQEMESLVTGEGQWMVGLCDRGSLDGLAYWVGKEADFFKAAGTSLEKEHAKYHSVIHLRSPGKESGYNHQNELRIETAQQAHVIDEKIHQIWSKHPRYKIVDNFPNFIDKAHYAIRMIAEELPECCRAGVDGFLDGTAATE